LLEDPLFGPWDPTINSLASVQAWAAEFTNIYGRAPHTIAKYAYDAATLLLTRIDQVSQVDGGGNLVIDRLALAAAVRNTANYQGVTSVVSLDVNGNRLHMQYTIVKNDDFTQTSLDPIWSWLGAEPTQWSLTEQPGFLRVYTQDDQANRLLQDAPDGDFEIRTHVYFTPTQNFQFGGLYLYDDENNFLAFGSAFCNNPPPACVGNGIYIDHIEGGAMVGSNYAMTTTLQTEAYLRVVATGANYTAYVSENGVAWTQVGAHTVSFVPQKVGLLASNAGQPVSEIPASFDYFVLTFDAKLLYLPLLQR
jgi:beta-xylosidase